MCIIKATDGKQIGQIHRSGHGLYWITCDANTANAVVEMLTLDQLCQCMGHISPEMAK